MMDSMVEEEDAFSISKYDFNKVEKNKKLITCGECSRFYLYILGAAICKLISI